MATMEIEDLLEDAEPLSIGWQMKPTPCKYLEENHHDACTSPFQ